MAQTWYRTGTIRISAGSTEVFGDATFWNLAIQVGDRFTTDSDRFYEITAVDAGGGKLTIRPAWAGPSITAVVQVTTLNVSIATGSGARVTNLAINGVDYSHTSDETPTAGKIAIGLVDLINGTPTAPVTATTTAISTSVTATVVLTGKLSEPIRVTSSSLGVATTVPASKGAAYAIDRNGSNTTNADLAARLADFIFRQEFHEDQFADWLGGSPTGGPNGDGKYPLTNALGVTRLVESPAYLMKLVGDGVAGAVNEIIAAIEDDVDRAELAADRAETAATQTQQDRDQVELDRQEVAANTATVATNTATAVTSAAAALVSEGKAKTSETNAKTSETNTSGFATAAAASAAAALVSEGKAKTSETNAKTSETSAKASELAAKASELVSKASETASKNSEVNAGQSAGTATNQASDAAASAATSVACATAAQVSEINAKTSETNSKASEINAKASETSASGNAASAGNSATAANSHRIAAELAEDNAKASETLAVNSASTAVTAAASADTRADDASLAASDAATSAITAADNATLAVASRIAAAGSETTALGAANTATDKATVATTQAGIATTKALEASGYLATVQTSAIAAATSATGAETAKLAAQALQVTASGAAVTATDKAAASSASAENAYNSAQAAAVSATDALNSKTDMANAMATTATYRDQALVHREKAFQWASAGINVQVEPGQYSSYHWALRARDSADQAAAIVGGQTFGLITDVNGLIKFAANSASDALSFAPGAGVAINFDAVNRRITIANTNADIEAAPGSPITTTIDPESGDKLIDLDPGAISHAELADVGTNTHAQIDTHIASTTASAHGSTSANTVNRLVQRDASGNFAAGTVTAALAGNATTATTLQNPRTIAITGKVTGTATSFNGGANIAIDATAVNADTLDGLDSLDFARRHYFECAVPTTLNGYVEIFRGSLTNGAQAFKVAVVVGDGSFSRTKLYDVAVAYQGANTTYKLVPPSNAVTDSPTNDFELEVNVSTDNATFRLKRTAGTTVGTAEVTVVNLGISTITALTGTGTSASNSWHDTSVVATGNYAGAMSATDKAKLDLIASGANNYTHPSGDGNLHVPATGTTNDGRFLKAGATAGALMWAQLVWSDIKAGLPTTRSGYGIIDAQPLHAALTSISGLTTSADQMLYTTALNTYATTTLTTLARSLLAGSSQANMLTTLGAQAAGNYVVSGAAASLGGTNIAGTVTIANPNTNSSIEMGRTDGVANTPFIDFHSGATATDFDTRILATGGTGVAGGGTLSIYAASLQHNGNNVLTTAAGTAVNSTQLNGQAASHYLSPANLSAAVPVSKGGTGLTTTPANGQIPIGNASGYTLGTITGTANHVNVSVGAGTINLSLPQRIDVLANPAFLTMTLGAANGTAPLSIASTTQVDNLNAQLHGGLRNYEGIEIGINTVAEWIRLGRFSGAQGDRLLIEMVGNQGYSNTAVTERGGVTTIAATLGNNSNTGVGNCSGSFACLDASALTAVKFVQVGTDRFAYDVFVNRLAYAPMSLRVSTIGVWAWSVAGGQSDPGADSATVKAATNLGKLLTSSQMSAVATPSTIAQRDSANRLFAGGFWASATQPFYILNDTDATSAERVWVLGADAGTFSIVTGDNSGNPTTQALTITRSGTTPGVAKFLCPLQVSTALTDANTQSALDVQGGLLRIGDPFTAQTFANGIGIKFMDQGAAHASQKWDSAAQVMSFGKSSASNFLAIDASSTTFDMNLNTKASRFYGAVQIDGTATAPTPSAGTNNTQVATTAFVQTALGGLSGNSISQGDTSLSVNDVGTGEMLFRFDNAVRLRATHASGVTYLQAGVNSSDTAADLTISRNGSTNTNIRNLRVYANNIGFYGSMTLNGNLAVDGTGQFTEINLSHAWGGFVGPMIRFQSSTMAPEIRSYNLDGTFFVECPDRGTSMGWDSSTGVLTAKTGRETFAVSSPVQAGQPVSIQSDGSIAVAGKLASYARQPATIPDASSVDDPVMCEANGYLVAAWRDGSVAYYSVGTPNSDGSVSWGGRTAFAAASVSELSIAYINTRVVIAYRDVDGLIKLKVGSFSGAILDLAGNSPVSVTSSAGDRTALGRASTAGVIAYYEGSVAKVRAFTVTATSATLGTAVNLPSASVDSSDDVQPSATFCGTRAIVGFVDTSFNAKVVAVAVSGTTITLGTAVTVAAGMYKMSVANVGASTFAVTCSNLSNFTGVLRVGSLSTNTITLGTAVTSFTSAEVRDTFVCFANSVLYVWIKEYNNGYARMVTATVSGTTITLLGEIRMLTYPEIQYGPWVSWATIGTTPYLGYREGDANGFRVVPIRTGSADTMIGVAEQSATTYGATVSVAMFGATTDLMSGLLPASFYYVGDDGTISTANTGKMIGIALSATKMHLRTA